MDLQLVILFNNLFYQLFLLVVTQSFGGNKPFFLVTVWDALRTKKAKRSYGMNYSGSVATFQDTPLCTYWLAILDRLNTKARTSESNSAITLQCDFGGSNINS